MPLSPRLKEHGVPLHLQGLHQYWFETPRGLEVECWLAFEPAEPETHDHPGTPSSIHLLHAFVAAHDVTELIGDIMRDMIEFRARAYMEHVIDDNIKADALGKE